MSIFLQLSFHSHFSFSLVDREHTFVTCGSPLNNGAGTNRGGSDYSCLDGEGKCMEIIIKKPLLKTIDKSEHNLAKEMREYELFWVGFSIGCSCQIKKGSHLEKYFFRN